VDSLAESGADCPGSHHLGGGDIRMKNNIVAEFTRNTGQHDVGRCELWSCDETTAKKRLSLCSDD